MEVELQGPIQDSGNKSIVIFWGRARRVVGNIWCVISAGNQSSRPVSDANSASSLKID